MSLNFVVTSGEAYVDIDAVACAIAYAELLQLEGKSAEVVFPGVLNASITPSLRALGLDYSTEPSQIQSKYVVVDVSEPEFIAKCAVLDDIVEVFDHHPGFETYWSTKLGSGSRIESIGACATLIWEEFKKRGQDSAVSEKSTRLLLAAIVSNTLNFGAVITHERDREAYEELSQKVQLPHNWVQEYFLEQEQAIMTDLVEAITSDTKVLSFPQLESPVVVGQLELWDGERFLKSYEKEVQSALRHFSHPQSIMNILSLSEGKSRFYSQNQTLKEIFSRVLGVKFEGDFGVADRLWLRKEILRKFGK